MSDSTVGQPLSHRADPVIEPSRGLDPIPCANIDPRMKPLRRPDHVIGSSSGILG
ncbi:hypothetical protein [Nocardia callitridis]|uniref:hypothetical protein n=1 Tax=Nocardia callitridis TaxID=648753 RepID=UPI0031F04990